MRDCERQGEVNEWEETSKHGQGWKAVKVQASGAWVGGKDLPRRRQRALSRRRGPGMNCASLTVMSVQRGPRPRAKEAEEHSLGMQGHEEEHLKGERMVRLLGHTGPLQIQLQHVACYRTLGVLLFSLTFTSSLSGSNHIS